MFDIETTKELEAIIAKYKAQYDGRDFDYVQDNCGNLSTVAREDSALGQYCWIDHWHEQFTGDQLETDGRVNLTFADVMREEFQEIIDHEAGQILADPHLDDVDADQIRDEIETSVWEIVNQMETQAA